MQSITKKKSSNPWLLVFLAVLLLDLIMTATGNSMIRMISKPLLLIVLFRFFAASKIYASHQLYKMIIGALFFSWAGDVLLLLEANDPKYFMFGLGAFLVAHIFYCLFFNRVRQLEKITFRPVLVIPVLIYYAVLMFVLKPFLGALAWPVRIYGLVISLMLLLAMHMPSIIRRKAGREMLAGALLFIVSDSLLAFNKFYHSFLYAGVLIMLSYGLAQLLIIRGAAVYLDRSRAAKRADGVV